jgi:hypothetical protein
MRNQEKCLIHLKNLAEMLKGHKIIDGYDVEDHDETTNGDMTAQQNKEYFEYDSNTWVKGINGITVQ